jgi:hypothetical protein
MTVPTMRMLSRAIGCGALLSALGFSGSLAQEGFLDPPTTVLSMPDTAGAPGAVIEVPITAVPADGILGVDMTITYDPAVLTAQDVLVTGIAASQGFAIVRNLNTPGTIVMSMYATQNPLTGSGEIARIRFRVIGGVAATSPLVFNQAAINEGLIPRSTDDGLFTAAPTILSMPDSAQGGSGAIVEVPMSVSPGNGILGVDLTITYNPAVLSAQDVTVSGIGAAAGFALAKNLTTPGVIVVSTYATGDLMNGSGEFLRIHFLVTGSPGDTSSLTFASASINEGQIAPTIDHGLFSVTCAGASDGTACSDGNACTQTDTCQAGVCTGATPVVCAANACQDPGTCNPSTGICSAPVSKPDGTFCGDAGTECTNQDTCLSGACQDNGFQAAGTACGSSASGACDAADSCNGTGVCQVNHVADGTSCGNAGTACTNQDTCLSGACQDNGFQPAGTACGTPATGACDAADTCNGSGVCQDNHAAVGTSCGDEGTACTNQDTCLSGACQDNGFQPAGTSCGNPALTQCTVPDTCSGSGSCLANNLPDGTSCGDTGTQCVSQDACLAGACHDNGIRPNGTSCDDGNVATCSDVCAIGTCAGTFVAEPAEIDDSLRVAKGLAGSEITWSDPPGPFNVYRGVRGSGAPWLYDQTCLYHATSETTVNDPGNPPPGTLYYYVVSRESACRESILAEDSEDVAIPNASSCSGTPADADADGIANASDNCPTVANTTQSDTDLDTVGDACDNCRKTPNPGQQDGNGNGIGDACITARVGAWTTGLTHTAGAGIDRLLVLMVAHASNSDVLVNAVTYGGQALTRINGGVAGSTKTVRMELWYLREAGIAAATNGTFVVTYGSGNIQAQHYAAATFRNVDQIAPILDSRVNVTNSSTPNPFPTPVTVTSDGMAAAAAISGNTGLFTWGNGWTEGIDQSFGGSNSSTADHPSAASGTDTAAATHDHQNFLAIVAASLKVSR